MITQIYGVKNLPSGEKERRYYGDVEDDINNEIIKSLYEIIYSGCDYAYAKQIGVGTVCYVEASHDVGYPEMTLPPGWKGANLGERLPKGRLHPDVKDQKQPF